MRRVMRIVVRLSLLGLGVFAMFQEQALQAQETGVGAAATNSSASPGAAVPRLVWFSGVLKDRLGQPLTGVQGVTFALYKEQQDTAALWLETQNVTADEQGRFTALFGATQPEGLPLDLFTSRQAQWLGSAGRRPGGAAAHPARQRPLCAGGGQRPGGGSAGGFLLRDSRSDSQFQSRPYHRGDCGDRPDRRGD